MNVMSLLLQKMTKVETPGCVAESLTTDNKKDLHARSWLKNPTIIMMKFCHGFL
jgi:hypothetical protein